MIELALAIAMKAHQGQKDKAGTPYIFHPIRVAERCHTTEEKIVALLHDVIEDTSVTPEFLLEKGFSQEIVEGVLSVTRKAGETYEEFVVRASHNKIGKQVKIHDLEDNMDIRRLKTITDEDKQRLEKYLKAYRFLTKSE